MARHNISESARLTGLSRRTIQRHVKAGKVSAKTDHQGQPYIETSELIRAYGELVTPPDAPGQAPVTPPDTAAQVDQSALLAALESLTQEVSSLRQEIAELRALPAPAQEQQPAAQLARPEDDPDWPQEADTLAQVRLRRQIRARYRRN